jgi:hypothetical protein
VFACVCGWVCAGAAVPSQERDIYIFLITKLYRFKFC